MFFNSIGTTDYTKRNIMYTNSKRCICLVTRKGWIELRISIIMLQRRQLIRMHIHITNVYSLHNETLSHCKLYINVNEYPIRCNFTLRLNTIKLSCFICLAANDDIIWYFIHIMPNSATINQSKLFYMKVHPK